jgi:dTDP-glucose 4,6-dehydratase
MTIIVTGGASLIGSNFVLDWPVESDKPVINLDALTSCASYLDKVASLQGSSPHGVVKGDIGDVDLVAMGLAEHQFRPAVSFAAESRVERSIHGPEDLIQTSIVGTFCLPEAVRAHRNGLDSEAKDNFRFLHVSNDEVYGSLEAGESAVSKTHRYEPNRPASGHLARAYHHTDGLPVLTTNSSNNCGSFHFPGKLTPLVIHDAPALTSPCPSTATARKSAIGSK